jgi:hypothetical protein
MFFHVTHSLGEREAQASEQIAGKMNKRITKDLIRYKGDIKPTVPHPKASKTQREQVIHVTDANRVSIVFLCA